MNNKNFGNSFFKAARLLTIEDVATLSGGEVVSGAPTAQVWSFSTTKAAATGALCFVENTQKLSADLREVACVLCKPKDVDQISTNGAVVVVAEPQLAFSKIVEAVFPQAIGPMELTGPFVINDNGASVSGSAALEADVLIQPGAVIGSDVEVGQGTVIGANAVIADGVKIGRGCHIGATSTIQCAFIGDHVGIHPGVQIGQDGFGYLPTSNGLHKLPHIGRVIIQNSVEIGSGTTIDRGTIGDTVIGEGAKIDNLVQVAHNVVVGRHAVLCAQVGLAGSSAVGDGAMMGGRAALADGVEIGAGTQVAATSGVMNNIPPGERWAGTPAQKARTFFREQAALRKLGKANKPS